METEQIVILNVNTGEAVQSVNDLKDNIKVLKERLGDLQVGSEDYQKTLNELKLNQNALKDAMYATSGSMEDVAKGAAGMTDSYNSLVHRMAALKEEFRSTTDEIRRADLGQQIKDVNDRLKEMDALQGNYQRNVGNYAESIKKAFAEVPEYAGPVKKAFESIDKTSGLLSKNPLIGVITLLFPLIKKITESLKGNETAIEAVHKAMSALQPVFDVVTKVIETLAGWLSQVVDWFVRMAGESGGTFQKIIAGAVGVGNVLLQYLLTPVRTIVNAFKGLGKIVGDVFKGNFKDIKKDATEAFDGIKDAFVKGFSFKDNFAKGKEIGEQFAAGLGQSKNKVAESVASVVSDGISKGVKDGTEKALQMADLTKAMAKIAKEGAKEWDSLLQDIARADEQFIKDEMDAVTASINESTDDLINSQLEALDNERTYAEQRIETLFAVAGATSSVLNSIADMYEQDAEGSEKSAKQAKAIRIAAATIDTIAGATAAFMSAQNLMFPLNLIVGGVQAAAVTAAGLVNIAKIRNTQINRNGASTPSVGTTGASVSAPTIDVGIPQTSIVQSNSQEDLLNRMAGEQKVYILQSDIEASANSSRARVAEASY